MSSAKSSSVCGMHAETDCEKNILCGKQSQKAYIVSLKHHLGLDEGRVLGSAIPELWDEGGIEQSCTHSFFLPTDQRAFVGLWPFYPIPMRKKMSPL